MKPRCLNTARTGVFFSRTLSRLLSIEVGTASSTRSARERAIATSEPRAPRIVRSILVGLPCKTPKFAPLDPPKHRQSQLSGSSELAIQPQPFVHTQSHPPAEHLAIVHPRKWSLKIVPSVLVFHRPTTSLLPNNQGQYASDLRHSFDATMHEKSVGGLSASANEADVLQQVIDYLRDNRNVRECVLGKPKQDVTVAGGIVHAIPGIRSSLPFPRKPWRCWLARMMR